jgi:hypothetical protein
MRLVFLGVFFFKFGGLLDDRTMATLKGPRK